MEDNDDRYQTTSDLDSFSNPAQYEQENIFGSSDNDLNSSLLSDKKAIVAIICASLISIGVIVGLWFFLFANNAKPKLSISEPSKNCVQLRKKVISAKESLKKVISSQIVKNASNIKSSDFDDDFDIAKDAVDDFESSLNYANDDLNEDIPQCPVGADSYDSPTVENKLSDKLDSLRKDSKSVKQSAEHLIKTSRTAFSDQLLNLVKKARELVEKAKKSPILAVASQSLENAINDAGNALAKSSNNYKELKQSYQKIKAVIGQYEEKIKKIADSLLNRDANKNENIDTSRDGNGYPLDAPHNQDEDGGYEPMGRGENPESSQQNNQQ